MKVVADFPEADDYLQAWDQQISRGGLLVPAVPAGTAVSECTLVVRIGGEEVAEATARLASSNTVIFPERPARLDALAHRLRAPPQAPKETLTLQEKLQLASSCDRDLRMQLLRDPNKQLHVLVLRNPRIGLEEVQWAARMTTLNPDALKLIAEHPEWGQSPAIAATLVRNPKTPLPVALRLVPRLPVAELRVLARSQGRPQVVQAAKKQLLVPR